MRNKFSRDRATTHVLASGGGVGQRVPSTVCTKVVLKFSERVKTVGKEGSLMKFHGPSKVPHQRQLEELEHLRHSRDLTPGGRTGNKTSLSCHRAMTGHLGFLLSSVLSDIIANFVRKRKVMT